MGGEVCVRRLFIDFMAYLLIDSRFFYTTNVNFISTSIYKLFRKFEIIHLYIRGKVPGQRSFTHFPLNAHFSIASRRCSNKMCLLAFTTASSKICIIIIRVKGDGY